MPNLANDRSQPLLRVPRDQTPVVITFDNGEREGAMLFVPPGDSIDHMLAEASQFVPVSFTVGADYMLAGTSPFVRGSVSVGMRLVARASMACITLHAIYARIDDEHATERQRVAIRVRGGSVIKGELRWGGALGRTRTLDHINEATPYIALREGDYVTYVAKNHIISVEEI